MSMFYLAGCRGWSVGVPAEPFRAAGVGEMLYLEVFECGLETVSVRGGCHEAYCNRGVVLQVAIAHHYV